MRKRTHHARENEKEGRREGGRTLGDGVGGHTRMKRGIERARED